MFTGGVQKRMVRNGQLGLDTRGRVHIFNVLNKEIIMVMSEFEVLLEKVAQRLAKNYRPHRATLNKLYACDVDSAFREYRLKARTMELRAEAQQRQAEIAETFARILSNPAQYETVGEPTTHNIKFLG
jgi:hypothetical protein